MSLDLSHGFLAEVQFKTLMTQQIFAANFLERTAQFGVTISPTRDLTMWFDSPDLSLVRHPDPAITEVEATIRLIARLSDRFDEARVAITARGRVFDRTVNVGVGTRACPSVDFGESAPSAFSQTFTDNTAYDSVVLDAVRRMLAQQSPYALGPLAASAGKRLYRTYFDIPDHSEGLLVMFVTPFGEPPTPATVPVALFGSDAMLLVPDDLVNPGIRRGLDEAGLGTLPAQLNPDVKVRSLNVTLQNGHIRIEGAATKTTDFLGIPVNTDFNFTAFVQPLVQSDGSVGIHVISTQQDLDDTFGDFADFITAGALTRLMERLVPAAVSGLSLGTFQGLDFFASTVADTQDSAPATAGSLPFVFNNGLGIPFDVRVTTPAEVPPPYFRGHVHSREFHIRGCQFGDRISFANLRKFPTREGAIMAGYDGCATCQPDFSIASFGDLRVEILHPPGVEPAAPVTVRATYAGDLVRFGLPLAPPMEEDISTNPVDSDGVPTHFSSFDHIVPTDWTVSVVSGGWSVETTVGVGTRFIAADGQLQGSRTVLRGTVGQPGLPLVDD